jgi:hypothetical protein
MVTLYVASVSSTDLEPWIPLLSQVIPTDPILSSPIPHRHIPYNPILSSPTILHLECQYSLDLEHLSIHITTNLTTTLPVSLSVPAPNCYQCYCHRHRHCHCIPRCEESGQDRIG